MSRLTTWLVMASLVVLSGCGPEQYEFSVRDHADPITGTTGESLFYLTLDLGEALPWSGLSVTAGLAGQPAVKLNFEPSTNSAASDEMSEDDALLTTSPSGDHLPASLQGEEVQVSVRSIDHPDYEGILTQLWQGKWKP